MKDPSLFQTESFVDGKWVGAKSGKRFDVIGMSYLLITIWRDG